MRTKIYSMSDILRLRQNLPHHITAPIIGVGKVFFAFPKADPFLPQIDSRSFHLVLIQNPCNFIRTDSFCIHAEYPAYNLCGFLVDQPVEFILGIFFVAINGDVCGRLARFTFNPNRCALLSAQIPKIPFVHDIEKRSKFVAVLVAAVHIIRNCNKPDTMLTEEHLRIKAGLQIITANA